MMDEQRVREWLADAQLNLRRLDSERAVVVTVIQALEHLLAVMQGQASNPVNKSNRGGPRKVKGQRSMRNAALEVVKEAQGEPVKAREMVTRMQALGVAMGQNAPERTADMLMYSLKKGHYPVEKVGARTWRWVSVESGT